MTQHLVILHPQWLERIADGRKSVEFRASDRRLAPWGRAARGDRLWFKASGGPVSASASVDTADFRGPFTADELDRFLADLAGRPEDALDDHWRARLLSCRYVSVIRTTRVALLPPIDVRDLRGRRQDSWQVLTADEGDLVRSRLNRGWQERLS